MSQQRIETIERMLANAATLGLDSVMIQTLQSELNDLKAAASGQTPQSSANLLLNQVQAIVAQQYGLTDDEVKQIAERVLAQSQIGVSQLAPEVIDLIDRTKRTIITINTIGSSGQITSRPAATMSGQRKLFYVIMSDVAANNNVYLYGPAGTGKTQMAKIVADALNYKVITINCNQFTSPIEIVGGQTIDGYQEGKLIIAWNNIDLGTNPLTNTPYDGALLLVDELPKLDPNTAGIMNDALSVLKDPPRVDKVTGKVIPKVIYNGANEEMPLKNLFVIATGNTLLLRPNPSYTANFAQDASLQDRFAGSTYKVTYDYQLEYEKVLSNITFTMPDGQEVNNINMAFLFNFLIDLRESILLNKYENEAFVSMRIMTNLRDTYLQYRSTMSLPPEERNQDPKTLEIGIESFMSLFTQQQRDNIIPQRIEDFIQNVIPDVNSRPLEQLSTDADIQEAEQKIAAWQAQYGNTIL